MENYDILIKNCQVLNPDMSVSSTCSVGIKDTWIKKIGSADEFADSVATETLDGKGKLVMPGLIDGHTHTCQQLFGLVSWFPLKAIFSRKILTSADS